MGLLYDKLKIDGVNRNPWKITWHLNNKLKFTVSHLQRQFDMSVADIFKNIVSKESAYNEKMLHLPQKVKLLLIWVVACVRGLMYS